MSQHSRSPRLALVGSGRLARAILRTIPHEVVALLVRDAAHLTPDQFPFEHPTDDPADFALVETDAIWIATADTAIAEVAAMLAPLRASWEGVTVIHSSGATSRAALDPFAERGARTLVLHPNAAFTGDAPIPHGLLWGTSSPDPDTQDFVRSLLRDVAPRLVFVAGEHQALYHAAASMASNYSVVLFAAAVELYDRAGIGPNLGAELVTRYMHESVERSAAAGAHDALTGPIVRGDEASVRAQRDAIAAAHPSLLTLFDAFAELTRRLVRHDAPKH